METLMSVHVPQPYVAYCFNVIFFQLYFYNVYNHAFPLFTFTVHFDGTVDQLYVEKIL
jgi:hypothetical protein